MILVDTNVLLDVVTDDPNWADWSIEQLEAAALNGPLLINDIVYAELSVRYERIERLFRRGSVDLIRKVARPGERRVTAVIAAANISPGKGWTTN